MANDVRTEDILNSFDDNKRKPRSSSNKKKKKRAHPWAFPLGLVVAILIAVGAVTIITAGVGVAKKAIIKVKNIDEYNQMLVPVVMNDPDMFDDLSKANMGQLLDIAIWSILKSDIEPDTYEYNDSGMVIPEKDVTKEFEKLFGTNIKPEHATVTGFGYEFTYDAASKCYTIPLTGVAPVYTPDVVDVEKKSNTVILTVAYLSADGWTQSSSGKMVAPSPDKYVKITLREGDSGYYISAIQATSTPETAVTAPVTVIVEETETTTSAPETTKAETTKENTTAEDSTSENTTKEEKESTTASENDTTEKVTEEQTSIQ